MTAALPGSSPRLSKSRFCSGLQCHKKLWLEVHEPDAPELEPDPGTRWRMDQGTAAGVRARTQFPGGVLIDLPHDAREEKIAATARVLAAGPPAIFEATFFAGGVYCAIDVLERTPTDHVLIATSAWFSSISHRKRGGPGPSSQT